MNTLEEVPLQCPYCGEHTTVLVDCSVAEQSYIEDCEVCCRPINLNVSIDSEGLLQVSASDENEA